MDNILKSVGLKVSEVSDQVVNYLASKGVENSAMVGKVVFLIVSLSLAYLVIKVTEKPIKWLIFALLIFLAICVGASFV